MTLAYFREPYPFITSTVTHGSLPSRNSDFGWKAPTSGYYEQDHYRTVVGTDPQIHAWKKLLVWCPLMLQRSWSRMALRAFRNWGDPILNVSLYRLTSRA
jgi:hypothetical protein